MLCACEVKQSPSLQPNSFYEATYSLSAIILPQGVRRSLV